MPSTHENIRAILNDVLQTTIHIGSVDGHFITDEQIQALLLQFFQAEDAHSNKPEEDSEAVVRARRAEVAKAVKTKTLQLNNAPPTKRSEINLQLGQLLSERAKLDKLLKQFTEL